MSARTYRAMAAVNQLHFHIGAGSIQSSCSCSGIIQWVHGTLQHHARAPHKGLAPGGSAVWEEADRILTCETSQTCLALTLSMQVLIKVCRTASQIVDCVTTQTLEILIFCSSVPEDAQSGVRGDELSPEDAQSAGITGSPGDLLHQPLVRHGGGHGVQPDQRPACRPKPEHPTGGRRCV